MLIGKCSFDIPVKPSHQPGTQISDGYKDDFLFALGSESLLYYQDLKQGKTHRGSLTLQQLFFFSLANAEQIVPVRRDGVQYLLNA